MLRSAGIGPATGHAAAALSMCLAVLQALHPVPGAQPPPALVETLAPLAGAPVPSGAAIALAVTAPVACEGALQALYEAAWRRPDLRWSLDTDDPLVAFVVVANGASAPPGSVAVWRAGRPVLVRKVAR